MTATIRDLRNLISNATDCAAEDVGAITDAVIEAAEAAGVERDGGTYEAVGAWFERLGDEATAALVDAALA